MKRKKKENKCNVFTIKPFFVLLIYSHRLRKAALISSNIKLMRPAVINKPLYSLVKFFYIFLFYIWLYFRPYKSGHPFLASWWANLYFNNGRQLFFFHRCFCCRMLYKSFHYRNFKFVALWSYSFWGRLPSSLFAFWP